MPNTTLLAKPIENGRATRVTRHNYPDKTSHPQTYPTSSCRSRLTRCQFYQDYLPLPQTSLPTLQTPWKENHGTHICTHPTWLSARKRSSYAPIAKMPNIPVKPIANYWNTVIFPPFSYFFPFLHNCIVIGEFGDGGGDVRAEDVGETSSPSSITRADAVARAACRWRSLIPSTSMYS